MVLIRFRWRFVAMETGDLYVFPWWFKGSMLMIKGLRTEILCEPVRMIKAVLWRVSTINRCRYKSRRRSFSMKNNTASYSLNTAAILRSFDRSERAYDDLLRIESRISREYPGYWKIVGLLYFPTGEIISTINTGNARFAFYIFESLGNLFYGKGRARRGQHRISKWWL